MKYSKMVMREDLRPKRISGILSKALDGETVILKKEDWRCFLLNRTASHIWQLFNGKNSIKTLIGSLSQKYGIKRSRARKDTETLLSYLKKHGLVNFVEK